MFKNAILASMALVFSPATFAIENFITQSTTPYPPACISTGAREDVFTPSSTRAVYASDIIALTAWPDTSAKANVEVEVYRRGCSDPDRSVMYISTNLIIGSSASFVPRVFAKIDGTRYPLRLVSEPNSYEQKQGGSFKGLGFREFIIDGVAESDIAGTENIISPEQYNSAFTLVIQDGFEASSEFEVSVAAYTGFQRPLKFPLNGRLSGNWVVDGVPDQGFVIAFSEFVDGNGARNLIFLSWYTYNPDGSTLWLVANTFYDLAADSVDLNIQLVTNGEFMANVLADRSDVGTATLTAENCNELTLDYDLASLGLGSGTVTLVRIFSVETAGFACRDQAARIEAL